MNFTVSKRALLWAMPIVVFFGVAAGLLWFMYGAMVPTVTVRQVLADPLAYAGKTVRVVGMADTREGAGRKGAGAKLLGEGFASPAVIYTPAPPIAGDGVAYVAVTGRYDAEAQVVHAEAVVPATDSTTGQSTRNRMADERRQFSSPDANLRSIGSDPPVESRAHLGD
ncbi:MAG: hypothetical protein JWL77_2237 [Chthonomonadaceae bacterium]|nr:hypothetical protein [Chthonomonadaceae bacterium]